MAWTATEIKEGQFSVTDGDIEVVVKRDFSGEVSNENGEYLWFEDVRDLIRAADLIKKALIENYGGWE